MRFLIPASMLLLAGCASTPAPPPKVEPTKPVVVEKVERGPLVGLSANELVSRLGTPRLQVKEGDGTKLQFANTACVIDAYLYPGSSGTPRVSHVDTRTRDGRNAEQQSCIDSIEQR
jgi:hypothetical protein